MFDFNLLPVHSVYSRRVFKGLLVLLALSGGLAQALEPWQEPLPKQLPSVAWPTQAWPTAEPVLATDSATLARDVDAFFERVGWSGATDTRALLVIQSGHIVVERYAPDFDSRTRFHSWSAAKTYTQALAGILIKDNLLQLDDPAPVPQWRSKDDPRGEITLRHLLHMTTGLDNADASGFVSDALFGDGAVDVANYSAERELQHPPGTHWEYSTATSTILAGVVGRAVGDNAQQRRDFMQSRFFAPIGAADTVFEFDAQGHFLGGSHLYANAHDYARMGLLYLRDGVWDGQRIFPPGWVEFTREPAPVDNNGVYGAHVWLNLEPKEGQMKLLPGAPLSAFGAAGNSGQYVMVVPSHDIVLVRLGEIQPQGEATMLEGMDFLHHALAQLLTNFPALPSAPSAEES